MSKRVEICGIDTNNLPKRTHEELMQLLKKAKSGSNVAREDFIMANMRLVLSVVQRFYNKKESADDLFQVGCVGLIKAMENFNPDYNLRFSTYAVPMIIGEIRRFLRDCSPVRISRSIRDNAYKIITARKEIENVYNREASLDEVAAALNMPMKDVVYAMDAISDPVSLYDPIYHDGDETTLLLDQIGDSKSSDDNWITSVSLTDAINSLEDRERSILLLRYYEGKTQTEVSEEIGISQAQVSRLEKNAKVRLKKNMN